MAYDIKFREAVLKYIDKGHTIRETARTFEVDAKTITNWRKLCKETGSLQDALKEKWHKKIDPVKLTAYYKENPDSYLSEVAKHFGCSTTAIFKAKKRLGITRKKTKRYVERCEIKREVFRKLISTLPKNRLYYVDECGIDTYVYRKHAYAPRGTKVYGNISGKKFKRANIVAAKCGSLIVAPMIYDVTTDVVLF